MKLAVVIVSPAGYPHSAAFDEVALGLTEALRGLGHDVVSSRNLAVGDRRAIVLGANLIPGSGLALPPDAVLYNLEQIDAASTWLTPALLALYRRHPVWDYSPANRERLAARGVPRPTLVPLGHVPALTRIPVRPEGEDIDVLFYGSLNPRRIQVLRALAAAGIAVEQVFGVYGEARDALIARAKIVLNLHYYEAKVFEVVRVSYLLANHKAVVSERGADRDEEAAFAPGVAFAAYDAIVPTCRALLADPAARAALARAGHALWTARAQATFVEPAIAALAPDPWAGSRPLRVLLAPELADPGDQHERALAALAREPGGRDDVTIGLALPRAALAAIPASLERAAAAGQGDLLLIERPADRADWRRLLAGASRFVATAAQPELRALAAELGVAVTAG